MRSQCDWKREGRREVEDSELRGIQRARARTDSKTTRKYFLILFGVPKRVRPLDCSPPGSSVHGILQGEHWSGLPCSSPGDLPNPGIEPASLTSLQWQVGSLPAAPTEAPYTYGQSLKYIFEDKCY